MLKNQCITVVQMVSRNQCWDHQLPSAADARKCIPWIEAVESKLRSQMFPDSPLGSPSPLCSSHTEGATFCFFGQGCWYDSELCATMFHIKRCKMCILYVIFYLEIFIQLQGFSVFAPSCRRVACLYKTEHV